MHKSLIALTAAAALLLSPAALLSLGAEAGTVPLEESASAQSAWAPEVWPSAHWSMPYVRVLVEAQILSLYEVEMLNRKIGPDGLLGSSHFQTYASRTLKTTLPSRVLSSAAMSREQMADTLYRMITYSGYESMPAADLLDHDLLHWKDADQFAGYGYQASLALRWAGIASGEDGYFHPQRLVTVAEGLTVLAKTKLPALRLPLQPAPGEDPAGLNDPLTTESTEAVSLDAPSLNGSSTEACTTVVTEVTADRL